MNLKVILTAKNINVFLQILSTAHFYKEVFLRILEYKDRDAAKKSIPEWINGAFNCGIPQFERCAKTMSNWITGILNSFSSHITNGFTEGCNNKIKVLKRNAFGYRNLKLFINLILNIFSQKNSFPC